MDVDKGFVIGIFNYCDRWCETCAFTSRCRLFADTAEMEASLDPALKPIVEAPPLPEDLPPPPPGWMQELIAELNEEACKARPPEDAVVVTRPHCAEHAAIEERARGYNMRVRAWMEDHPAEFVHDAADPRSVVVWFHTMIAVKIHSALSALGDDEGDDYPREWPNESDGRAKVALLGIERSHAAWLDLVERGAASGQEAAVLIADLVWLADEVERVFPKARAFVRPGIDEPDEMSRLDAVG